MVQYRTFIRSYFQCKINNTPIQVHKTPINHSLWLIMSCPCSLKEHLKPSFLGSALSKRHLSQSIQKLRHFLLLRIFWVNVRMSVLCVSSDFASTPLLAIVLKFWMYVFVVTAAFFFLCFQQHQLVYTTHKRRKERKKDNTTYVREKATMKITKKFI